MINNNVIGVAPSESEMVTSVPPSYTGGNIDDWRIGKGATVFYPVSVGKVAFGRTVRELHIYIYIYTYICIYI
jgi:hypothetical protein